MSDKNSPRTNTAERNASKALYDLAVEPAANAALAVLAPAKLGALGIQVMGGLNLPELGQVRENFVTALAGRARPKNSQGYPAR